MASDHRDGPTYVDGTMFFGAPRGRTGLRHPTFVVYDGGIEVRRNKRPRRLFEGLYVFDCPFDELDPIDLEDFVCKREFSQASEELKVGSSRAGAGGTVFGDVVSFIANYNGLFWRDDLYREAKSAMYYTNKDQVVAVEQAMLVSILNHELDEEKFPYIRMTEYRTKICDAVLYGIDRQMYLHEDVEPSNLGRVMQLGFSVLELVPDELLLAIIEGQVKITNGDLLKVLGINIGDEPLDLDVLEQLEGFDITSRGDPS